MYVTTAGQVMLTLKKEQMPASSSTFATPQLSEFTQYHVWYDAFFYCCLSGYGFFICFMV